MKRTVMAVVFSAATLVALPGMASAQAPAFNGLEDLVVTKDQAFDIPPGGHRFRNITLGENATLRLKGSTTILAGKVKSEKGAKIEYIKNSAPTADKVFTLNAVDASELRDLTVIGSGADAAHYPQGQRAKDGAEGRGASSRLVTGKVWEVPYYKNEASTEGGSGAPGERGRKGEDAMDVTLYLPAIRPGSTVTIEAIGGNGGRGEDGGAGGRGGGSSKFHTASRGGPGGSAGAGGAGGDSGKISVFIVVAPAEVSKKDEIIKAVTFRPSYGAGEGGPPGDPGPGGTKGDSGDHFCIGAGCGSDTGAPGATAQPGPAGAGPRKGEQNPGWAVIDIMDLATYQQYVAQIWTTLGR